MQGKSADERLGILETQMVSLEKKVDDVDKSISNLHLKIDGLVTTLSDKYVSKDTFDEWKKNRWLERMLIIIVTAALSGLIAFFLRENRI